MEAILGVAVEVAASEGQESHHSIHEEALHEKPPYDQS